jgi:hypothetical protein
MIKMEINNMQRSLKQNSNNISLKVYDIRSPFMVICRQGFIMCQYEWKSALPDNFRWLSQTSNWKAKSVERSRHWYNISDIRWTDMISHRTFCFLLCKERLKCFIILSRVLWWHKVWWMSFKPEGVPPKNW